MALKGYLPILASASQLQMSSVGGDRSLKTSFCNPSSKCVEESGFASPTRPKDCGNLPRRACPEMSLSRFLNSRPWLGKLVTFSPAGTGDRATALPPHVRSLGSPSSVSGGQASQPMNFVWINSLVANGSWPDPLAVLLLQTRKQSDWKFLIGATTLVCLRVGPLLLISTPFHCTYPVCSLCLLSSPLKC